MNQKTIFISALSILVLLFIAGTWFYKNAETLKQQELATANLAKLMREGAPSKGDKNANVTIVEFLDPACGACARFHPFVKNLMANNPGKIRVIVRYAPFHQGSDYMVKILEASRKQGKFWQTLEAMFVNQSQWASHANPQPNKIWGYLGKIEKLDLNKLGRDLNASEINQTIKQDLQDATALNVTKTPEFFVNGRPLPSFGFKQLNDLVAEELSKTN
ncbi:MAG: thioredoxin domain-containing protein [Magnetococcales bacterium]|nr:thioredoxin domain-containing protein [Magnetococcales bacterium]